MKKLTTETAEGLALKMRATLRIGGVEPVSMKTALRQLGILTIYRPLSDSTLGLSLKSNDGKMFMLISSNATRGSQHFTIAHELFHLFYDENPKPHFSSQETYKDTAECSANLFASALLMPREGLVRNIPTNELADRNISIDTALKLEQLYGVSHHTLVVRLRQLKLSSPQNAEALSGISVRKEATLRGIDRSLYYSGNDSLIIGDYGIKAKRLFDTGRISEGHYVELMSKIGYGECESCS